MIRITMRVPGIFIRNFWRPRQCLAVQVLPKTGFWPLYCQISADLHKTFAHTYCCTEYTCGPT